MNRRKITRNASGRMVEATRPVRRADASRPVVKKTTASPKDGNLSNQSGRLPTPNDATRSNYPDDEFRLLNPGEVARILNCDRATAQRLMSQQQIHSKNIARPGCRRQWRTTRRLIAAFLEDGPTSDKEMNTPGIGDIYRPVNRVPRLRSGAYRDYRRGLRKRGES